MTRNRGDRRNERTWWPPAPRSIDLRYRPPLHARASGQEGVPTLIIPPPVQRIEAALEEARQVGLPLPRYRWCYGLPVVTDPRDFYPDPWHCTRLQLDAWMEAVQRWDRGEAVRFPAPLDERWGLGISLLRDHDDEYKDPSKPWKQLLAPEQLLPEYAEPARAWKGMTTEERWLARGFAEVIDPRAYAQALAVQQLEEVAPTGGASDDQEEWW